MWRNGTEVLILCLRPKFIRVRDQCEVVILSAEKYAQLVQRELSFVDFIRQSPLFGVEIDIERHQSVTRDVDLLKNKQIAYTRNHITPLVLKNKRGKKFK